MQTLIKTKILWPLRGFSPLCLFLILLCAGCARSAPPVVPLTITTAGGQTHAFRVELARTPAEQERGLMDRRSLPMDQGMLFVYDTPQQLTFWMKNTYIPLDILFIDAGNRIVFIHERAKPLSEALIRCPVPAAAVLEINGGRAAALGIRVGDTVRVTSP